MRTRLRSLEQLMPLPTAGELIAQRSKPLVSISPDTTARAALSAMEENDIGFLPVLNAGKLVGVLSERDIARGMVLQHRTGVRELMKTHVHTAAPETCARVHRVDARLPHPPPPGGEFERRARSALRA